MPLAYVKPEEAFEVRYQLDDQQIQAHCDAAPENDRRDFDDRGGLQIPVYHVYKDTNYPDPLTYWYTLDECEDDQYAFDIRNIPTWWGEVDNDDHEGIIQEALDDGVIDFVGLKMVVLTK